MAFRISDMQMENCVHAPRRFSTGAWSGPVGEERDFACESPSFFLHSASSCNENLGILSKIPFFTYWATSRPGWESPWCIEIAILAVQGVFFTCFAAVSSPPRINILPVTVLSPISGSQKEYSFTGKEYVFPCARLLSFFMTKNPQAGAGLEPVITGSWSKNAPTRPSWLAWCKELNLSF